MSKQPLKNVVSMLIKNNAIASYQLLLIKQNRMLVNYSFFSLTSEPGIFFYYFEKEVSIGRWEKKKFIGMA